MQLNKYKNYIDIILNNLKKKRILKIYYCVTDIVCVGKKN